VCAGRAATNAWLRRSPARSTESGSQPEAVDRSKLGDCGTGRKPGGVESEESLNGVAGWKGETRIGDRRSPPPGGDPGLLKEQMRC